MDIFKALQDTVLVPSEGGKKKRLYHISSVLFLEGAQAGDEALKHGAVKKGKRDGAKSLH